MELFVHRGDPHMCWEPLETFTYNKKQAICISSSLTKRNECRCKDCIFLNSGLCNSVVCGDVFFVYLDNIPDYVTYSPSLESPSSEPVSGLKRKHK